MGKSIWPAHWRDSCHLEGSIDASVECLVVGDEVVVVSSASRKRDPVEVLEVELEWRDRPAAEQAVAADVGLSTLGRRSTSRGRAAQQMNSGRRAAPAVLLSTITYRPTPLNGKALDRLGLWWWRVRTVVGSDHGCAEETVADRSYGRRGARLEIVGRATPLHGTTGGGRWAVACGISNGGLSNRPLQRTGLAPRR